MNAKKYVLLVTVILVSWFLFPAVFNGQVSAATAPSGNVTPQTPITGNQSNAELRCSSVPTSNVTCPVGASTLIALLGSVDIAKLCPNAPLPQCNPMQYGFTPRKWTTLTNPLLCLDMNTSTQCQCVQQNTVLGWMIEHGCKNAQVAFDSSSCTIVMGVDSCVWPTPAPVPFAK
jgi:hypothetical protein